MTEARALFARFVPYVVLAVVVAFAYAGLTRIGLVWDDPYVTVDNPFLGTWSGIVKIATSDVWSGTSAEEVSRFYRPLATLSCALDRAVLGNTPLAYHASSFGWHLVSVWLFYTLTRQHDPSRAGLASLAAALLFGVAPLGVEAVTWISVRCDLVGLALALGALTLSRSSGTPAAIASGALAGATVFAKETFLVVPLLLFAYETWILRRRPSLVRFCSVLAMVAAYAVLRRVAGVAAVGTLSSLTVADVTRSYAFLLETFTRLLLFPTYLDASRPYAPRGLGASLAVIVLACAVFLALVVVAYRRPADPRARTAVFGVGWFLFSLGPAAVAVPTLGVVGDRYAYFPMFGVFLAISALLVAVRAWWLVGLSLVGVGASVARTRGRVPDFHDDVALFSAALRDNPHNAFAWYMLGQIDAVAGRFDSAETKLWRAAELQPGSWRTDNGRCYVRLNQGRLGEALALCKKSASTNGSNPRVWANLAAIYTRQQRFSLCVAAADQGIAVKPHNVEASYLRAVCLANLARYAEATDELRRCLALAPGHGGANDLAAQFRAQGVEGP